MQGPTVAIFHQPAAAGDGPLTHLLAEAREALIDSHVALFRRAGAARSLVLAPEAGRSFGERLAALAEEVGTQRGGLIVLGSGATPLLRATDAVRLVEVARAPGRRALTNNRFSSDVCALSDLRALRALPALPSDNILPRWLERAGFEVAELPGRDRLALDVDSPLDLAIVAGVRGAPAQLRRAASVAELAVPRLAALRALAADPHGELLVAGRSGSRTLRWLESKARCRVRFLAEERGLRAGAASPAVPRSSGEVSERPPRSTLGRLLAERGPATLDGLVAELADGAIIDSRVLLADRLGSDERTWPPSEDRFASDLLRSDQVGDPWLRALTFSAAGSRGPILLGAHTLVGPGIPHLLRAPRGPA